MKIDLTPAQVRLLRYAIFHQICDNRSRAFDLWNKQHNVALDLYKVAEDYGTLYALLEGGEA